ncbi:MAG: Holliday junction branch migration protein RuvA [Mangrovibacterium sp.]
MFEYIKGKLTGLSPTHVVLEAGAIGYYINVSLNTYSAVAGEKEVLLYLHQVVREDAHLLYGFSTDDERRLFRLLISVSGIGANTAIVMLSSHTAAEISAAVIAGDVGFLKRIKGIGEKTAQRVIIDLKDKMDKMGHSADGFAFAAADSSVREDALSALVALGILRKAAEKAVDGILKKEPSAGVEQLIKQALKQL